MQQGSAPTPVDLGAQQREFWQWSAPGHTGQAATRDDAMLAIRASWDATDEALTQIRRDQEWSANKYALWAAGDRNRMVAAQSVAVAERCSTPEATSRPWRISNTSQGGCLVPDMPSSQTSN